MCSYIVMKAKLHDSSAKGPKGWMSVDTANVYYDHPAHAPLDHALGIDFINEAAGGRERVAVKLSAEFRPRADQADRSCTCQWRARACHRDRRQQGSGRSLRIPDLKRANHLHTEANMDTSRRDIIARIELGSAAVVSSVAADAATLKPITKLMDAATAHQRRQDVLTFVKSVNSDFARYGLPPLDEGYVLRALGQMAPMVSK